MALILRPEKAALVVVDMQNGFIDPAGPITVPGANGIVEPIRDLVRKARLASIPVVWTRVSLDGFQKGAYPELFPAHFAEDGTNAMPRGSHWHSIVEPLSQDIIDRDLIIDKDRYDAFFQTNLELRLRQGGVEDLIICGVTTNVCVEGTVRGAFDRNFRVFMVSDCTRTFSQALQSLSEEVVGFVLGFVVTREQVYELIQSHNS